MEESGDEENRECYHKTLGSIEGILFLEVRYLCKGLLIKVGEAH